MSGGTAEPSVAQGAPGFRVVVGSGKGQSVASDGTLLLNVADHEGSYTIPYIQADRSLSARVIADASAPTRATLTLWREQQEIARCKVAGAEGTVTFRSLGPGEYTLVAQEVGPGGELSGRVTLRRIGIGLVIAAIGDSITEGYWGHRTKRDVRELRSGDFPAAMVSKDGRNFPQFAPTTKTHAPDSNVMQSWMTELNDLLSRSLGQPVFIANEGWGGYTTGQYLRMIKGDKNWQARMRLLRPSVWLIHLGVNDERAKIPAGQVADNLAAIVKILRDEYGASPQRILMAKPCYDYAAGAEAILKGYCERIDKLRKEKQLAAGPDFFAAYATDKQRWYGADPVHPNVAGMTRMAELWGGAIVAALGNWGPRK